jgi:hypothetical protein
MDWAWVVRTAERPGLGTVAHRDQLVGRSAHQPGHAVARRSHIFRSFALRRTDPAFEHALQEAMPKERALGAGGQLDQGSDRRAFLAVVPAAAVTD